MWEKENTRYNAAHAVRRFCHSESPVRRCTIPKLCESLYTAPYFLVKDYYSRL